MTALTTYSLNTASTTLAGGAKQLVSALASGSTQANVATTIAKRTGWHELQGTAANAGASIAVTGTTLSTANVPTQIHGMLWEVTTLEGNTIAAGTTVAPVVRVLASATTISGKVAARYWKRSSAGVYTLIGQTVEAAASAFTTSLANRTLPTMTVSTAVNFFAGDKLYVELLVDVTANTANSTSSSISVAFGGTTSGSTNVFPSTDYAATPTPATPGTPTATASTGYTTITGSVDGSQTTIDVYRGGTLIAAAVPMTGATYTYRDATGTPGTAYTYTVAASNASGTSAQSAASNSATAVEFRKTNSLEGGSNTTALTAGNTGGTSGDAFDSIGGTTAPTFSNAHAAHGSLAMLTPTTGATGYGTWTIDANQPQLYWRTYLFLTAWPSAGTLQVLSSGATVTIDTAGAIKLNVNAHTVTMTNVAPTGAWFRLEMLISGADTGWAGTLRLFLTPDGSTPDETVSTSDPHTGSLFGSVGNTGPSPATGTFYFDDIGVSSYDWLGPSVLLAAPKPIVAQRAALIRASTR